MREGRRILALIPARGGSKGLPKKNIRPLLGKPLIAWTIEQAQASRYVDSVIVSTDDAEIARVSRRWGADVPFMRPKALSTDTANRRSVVRHALGFCARRPRYACDILLLLQPTSPLRTSGDIDASIDLMLSRKAKGIVSVCEAEHPPFWMNSLPPDGNLGRFLPRSAWGKSRQQLPTCYRVNGAIFMAESDHYLVRDTDFFDRWSLAYVMPQERSIDIDTAIDFKLAEVILRGKKR